LFLLLIGEDPANWPMNYRELERYSLRENLNELAAKIKEENAEKVSNMLRLKNRIFALVDECNDALELEKHKSSLQGRCQYL
jgi:hypothetical protein